MNVAGVDIGSATSKAVIIKDETIYHCIRNVEYKSEKEAEIVLADALSGAGLKRKDLQSVFVTGLIDDGWEGADDYISEISCAANGALYYFPNAKTAIDIGAENCRVTKFDKMSLVADYRMNQKCGSGTGLFLDVVANALEVDIQKIGELSLDSQKKINMNSACAVFAESEVVSLIHQGESRSDILKAVFDMIAAKTASLARAVRMEQDIVFIGGVSKNIGMVKAISSILGCDVMVPENPDVVIALGAAVEAREMVA